jgi:hypothetical protein
MATICNEPARCGGIWRRLALTLAVLTLCVGGATVSAAEWEWQPDEGWHEEEWYDPSDWGEDTASDIEDEAWYDQDYQFQDEAWLDQDEVRYEDDDWFAYETEDDWTDADTWDGWDEDPETFGSADEEAWYEDDYVYEYDDYAWVE